MKKYLSLMIAVVFLILTSVTSLANTDERVQAKFTQKACNYEKLQRRLWHEHVHWTNDFIVSDIANLEAKGDVLNRLLRNQDDLGQSIAPYYGANNAKQYAKLLREHIVLAGQVVDAAKAGNTSDLDKYNKLWYKNADDIAAFLHKLNPNWSKKVLTDMLHTHLKFVTDQAVFYLKKQWKDYINAYDKGEIHMLKFADIISKGIAKQFPQKF
jgi:hemerythrin-like domain-containing protein